MGEASPDWRVVKGVSGMVHKPKHYSESHIIDIRIKVVETACSTLGLWPY